MSSLLCRRRYLYRRLSKRWYTPLYSLHLWHNIPVTSRWCPGVCPGVMKSHEDDSSVVNFLSYTLLFSFSCSFHVLRKRDLHDTLVQIRREERQSCPLFFALFLWLVNGYKLKVYERFMEDCKSCPLVLHSRLFVQNRSHTRTRTSLILSNTLCLLCSSSRSSAALDFDSSSDEDK